MDQPEWTKLANMVTKLNSFHKLYTTALTTAEKERNSLTIWDSLVDIADQKDPAAQTMNPWHTVAAINAWCLEQELPPMKILSLYYMLAKGLSHKRIGIYMQGAPNSGKSTMTTNMWEGLTHLCGKLVNDNFPFQLCGDKKIILAEEFAIDSSNIDRIKQLMSGGKVKVERKNTHAAECQPSMVLFNSNVRLAHNLQSEQVKQMMTRVYLIENLKETMVFRKLYGNLDPRWLLCVVPPTDDMILNLQQNTNDWDYNEQIKIQVEGGAYSVCLQDNWEDVDKQIEMGNAVAAGNATTFHLEYGH